MCIPVIYKRLRHNTPCSRTGNGAARCLPHNNSNRLLCKPPAEVSITSPTNGQNVSTGELTISGTSSDTPDSQCLVYVDWNDRKPFQRAVAAGPGGNEDYSKWSFTYTDTYHTITNGTNDLTSKVSCIANPANLTKWSSINVTGVDGLTTPAEGQMSSVTQVQNSSSNGTNSTMASSIVVNSAGITSSLNVENSGAGGCGGVGGDVEMVEMVRTVKMERMVRMEPTVGMVLMVLMVEMQAPQLPLTKMTRRKTKKRRMTAI